jgi:hypothetical protein
MSNESKESPLHRFAHARFREVFGPPDNSLGRDDHWALKPDRPHSLSINVLINGTTETPAVWVFDPHITNDGVIRKALKNEEDVEAVIKQILDRLKQATAKGMAPRSE